jgi:hypothetical protein
VELLVGRSRKGARGSRAEGHVLRPSPHAARVTQSFPRKERRTPHAHRAIGAQCGIVQWGGTPARRPPLPKHMDPPCWRKQLRGAVYLLQSCCQGLWELGRILIVA